MIRALHSGLALTIAIVSLHSTVARGNEPGAPRVASGYGELAARADEKEAWRHLTSGDVLPSTCELAIGGEGPRTVALAGATLRLDANSRALVNSTQRTILLTTGRALVSVEGEGTWKLDVAGAKSPLALTENSSAQVSILASGEAHVDWIRGGPSPARDAAEQAERNKLAAWSLNRPAQGLGQLLIKDAQSESPIRLNIARYHANVVLQPPVALVQIDQSFYNPYHRQEEGTFVFNLPRGASVSRFAMYVTPTELIEGELIDRERANTVYTTIVRSKRDPAILEQIGDNLFRMRVFPIFPHDIKRILLDYTLPLKAESGVCRFDLPLLSDLAPIWDFRLQGNIQAATRPNSIVSLSHPNLAI